MKKTIIIALLTASVGAFAGGPSVNSVSESNSQAGAVAGAQSGASQNSQAVNFNNPGVVRYKGGYDLKNVPDAVAPGLTTTLTETCMGSSSVGGSGVGFGVSIGSTWRDEECVRRLHARELKAMGQPAAGVELLCGNPEVWAAMESAGTPCKRSNPAPKEKSESQPFDLGFGQ